MQSKADAPGSQGPGQRPQPQASGQRPQRPHPQGGQRPHAPHPHAAGQRSRTPDPEAPGRHPQENVPGGRSEARGPGGRPEAPGHRAPGRPGQRPQRPGSPQLPQRPQAAPQQRGGEASARTKAPPIPDALKTAIELASELAKKELGFRGKVGSMAVFVYPERGAGPEGQGQQGGEVKTVSLSNRNELQKEAVRKRIREKVAAETISTVVLVADGKKERTGRMPGNPAVVNGSIVITGVMRSASGSATVVYSFDKGTKAFAVWDFRWLDSFVDNYFLQNVFGTSESRPGNTGGRHRRNG